MYGEIFLGLLTNAFMDFYCCVVFASHFSGDGDPTFQSVPATDHDQNPDVWTKPNSGDYYKCINRPFNENSMFKTSDISQVPVQFNSIHFLFTIFCLFFLDYFQEVMLS